MCAQLVHACEGNDVGRRRGAGGQDVGMKKGGRTTICGSKTRCRTPTPQLPVSEAKSREVDRRSPMVVKVASDVSDGFAVKANRTVVCHSLNSRITPRRLGEAWCLEGPI